MKYTTNVTGDTIKDPMRIRTLEDIEKNYWIIYSRELEKIIDKALFNVQRIIAYGFDYDGFNNVDDLKGLIDMLVDYAIKTKDILKGRENE